MNLFRYVNIKWLTPLLPCEERAATSRCPARPDQRLPPERPRREHWRGMCSERSDRTARDSADHRHLTEG